MARTATKRRTARTTAAREREVDRLERSIRRAKARLEGLRRRLSPTEVPDYAFGGWDGKPVRLSQMFGGKDDLVVVHNMGTRCPMCTMWADGFDGLARHLADRAGFVVTSPDPVRVQKAFARRRGWRFPMASAAGNGFFRDMGFEPEPGKPWPGVSTFRREPDGRLLRVARASFGPGDDFCPVFALVGLLRDGQAGWWPKLDYAKPRRRR